MTDENISYRITRFRETRGLSKGQVARPLGVTERYIDMIEKGTRDVDPASSLYKLFSLMESNIVQPNFEPETHRQQHHNRVASPATEYKVGKIPAGIKIGAHDLLEQARADLDAIETGTPAEKRRALLFLRDFHIPLLAQIFEIDC